MRYHFGSLFWVARILNYPVTVFFLSCFALFLIIWLSAFPAKVFLLKSPDIADWLHLPRTSSLHFDSSTYTDWALEWKDVYNCFSSCHLYVGSIFIGIPSAIISFFSSIFTGNFYYRHFDLTSDRNKKVDKCSLFLLVFIGLCYALYHIFIHVYDYVRQLSGMFTLVILDAPQWREKKEAKVTLFVDCHFELFFL